MTPAPTRPHRTPRALAALAALVALLIATLAGAAPTGAEISGGPTPETADPEAASPNMGWYVPAPTSPSRKFNYYPECVDTDAGPALRVRVRTIMWAKGRDINAFHFRVRLVPIGSTSTDPWSNNVKKSFTPTRNRVERAVGAWTPPVDPNLRWEIEVKMKFGRESDYPAFHHRVRVRIHQPCGGGVIVT